MMKKLLLLCLFVLAALLSQAQSTYYWVKGAGAWEDINHWSSTSGGTPNKAIVPGPDDDVYFDANSGLVNGTIVTLPAGSHAYCRNMSWVGVTGNATFRSTSSASKYTIYISGSAELASSVAYGMVSIMFNGPTPATFKINGAARVNAAGWYNPFTVDKPGSSLKILGDIPGSFAAQNVFLTNGKLDLSGGIHTFGSFTSTNNNVREVDITNATLIMSTVSPPSTWDLRGTNYTLYATGSYIQATNFGSDAGNYPKVDITGAGNGMAISGTTLGTLTFTNTSSAPGMVRIGMNNTIDQLEFKSHGNIRAGGNQIARLLMAPGKQLLVWGSSTITALLRMNSQDCAGLSEILGADALATFNFGAGATTDLRNVYAKAMTFGGSIVLPVSFQGLDGGGNTGMDIQPLSGGTTMYWVGGAGDWNDQNHWSATSGGTGGYCVPLSADNVIFDANSGFAPGNNTVSTTTNTWCHNMTWTNLSTPVTFTTAAGYTAEVWGSLSLDPNVTMTATLTMKGAEDVTLTTNGFSQGRLILTITKPVGAVTLTDNFTNPQVSILLTNGQLYMAGRKLDIYEFKSNTNNARTIDITNATITTSYNWELTGTGRTWVNNGAGSFITSNDYFLVSGLTYPKVYCTGDLDHFNISGSTVDELVFTSPNPLSKANIGANNIIGTLEFKGAGDIRGGGNQIARLLMAPSSINKFAGNNTIKERIRLNSATCSGLGEMRGPGTLNFSPGVTFDLANVYIQNMTATGSGIPVPVTGVDAGGNTGFSITATAGGNRYWVGGSGDWNDPSHWSASSGGAGGACVPTAIDNVFFDANSFTNGSSTVSVATGNAYCRNMDWTGAGFNPVFNHTTSFSMEIWGNLVMNPAVTMNASPVFKGPSDVTITTNGSGKGTLVISIDKPIANTVRFLDNFINPLGSIALKSGIVDLTGLTIKLSSVSDFYATGPTNIKITNATINVGEWYYVKSTTRTVDANGSSITATNFYTSGCVYNKVNVQTSDGNKIAINGATIADLLFSNTANPSGANIAANNTIGRLEFKSSGRIVGINNTIGTLIFTPGKIYTFGANTNTTITGDWFGSGTPCNLTEINTAGPANATITKTTGSVNFDYIRVKGITAAGITPFNAGEHSQDQGSNVNWSFKPYNGSAPITGLGPDLTLCSDKFPYTLTTDGFFGSPMCQYKWNDGSTDPTLVVTQPGTYSVKVTFPDGCSSSGSVKITESKVVVPAITGNLNVCEQATTLLANTTPGGIWSSNATTVATIDATGLVTGIKAGTADMMYEVTNADGCKASQTATVTVNALPVVSPIAGTTSVCVGVTTALNNITPGGVWSSSNTAIATVNASGVVTGVTAGTADIIYEVTNANGCKAQQKATVTVKALPVVSPITGTTNVCVGSTTTLNNATAGGAWSSSNTAVATVDANGLVMGVAVGSANIIYEVTNADGCKAQQIATVTVNALPVVSPITGTTSVCVGATTTLSSTTTGGVWGSSNTTVATIDASGLVTGISAGTVTITYEVTNASGCKAQQTTTVTVNALPVVNPITGTTSVCVGVTTALNSTTPGGVWSSSNTAVATIDANGLVTGISAGTSTITYEVTNANGCKSKQTATITVNALPVLSPITGTNNVCIGLTTNLANTTPGGIWSSSNIAVATVDASGLVTGVSAGTSTITYEVTNANGCKAQQTTTVTVNALPVVSPITGTNSVCVGVTTTLNNTTPGGVWSSSNPAVATVDANGLVAGVSAGAATITYEVTNASGCKTQQTTTVTVNALPVVSPITGTTSVCIGFTTSLNNTTPGGIWSSGNTAVATIDANGLVTGVSAGTSTITYEVTNANGCKVQQTATITVGALPVVSPISGTNNVCIGFTTNLANTTPGGIWSSSNTAVATIDASGLVTGISAGTTTITYEVTNANGCKAQQTTTVTVNALPVVSPITGTNSVCIGFTTALNNTTPGGVWSSSNTAVATIDASGLVTGISAGTSTITYEVTNANGCKAQQTTTVTVNALPVVSPITGTTSVCIGFTTSLNNTTPGGIWSSSNTAVATIDASGLVTGISAGTATITYEVTNANGCKAQQTTTVTVNALPVVSPITGTNSVCIGFTTNLANTTLSGIWSSSNTAVATIDANGLVTGISAGTATIIYEVTNANGCKAQQTTTVTVNALPVVSPITGTTSVCVGVTTILNNTTPGGIWSSSNTTVATIDASGLVTGVSAGTATITYEITNANGCKAQQTATVTVNALPVVSPITGTASVCVGVTTALNNTIPGGIWSSSNTAVATIDASGLVTGISAGTTTITYEVTNANGCKAQQTTTVTVNALPVVSPITGTNSVCIGFTTALNNTTPGGVWSSSNTAVATIDASGLVTGISAGTSTITYEVTNANGCKAQQTTTVTVNALPVVSPITGTTSVCIGFTTSLNNTTPGGIWSSGNTAVATIDANGLVTGVSAGTSTITYEVTNANGCKVQQTATITVGALPVVSPITGTNNVCIGFTTNLANTTPGGIWSSSNTAVATIDASGLVTGISAGTATITYEVNNANGCKAQQTTTVTVNALPVVSPITGTNNVCIGFTTNLANTTPGGIWSSSNTAVATIDANGLVTGVSAGTATITYEVTNANGCKAQQTTTVTVNALPVVSPITGTTSVCVGVTTALSTTTPGGIWSSSNTAVATIDANGLVTGVSAGTATITYEVTNANGCKAQQTTTVTVNALPVVSPINGTTSVCVGVTTALSTTTPGGIWSSSNTAVATIDANGLVTGVSTGTATITYEVTNASGCKAQQTTTVTVNALPVVSPITGTTSVCVGVTTTLNNTMPGGVWSSSNTAVATIDASGVVTGVSAGTATITYEVTNASNCKSQQTVTITVYALPVVSPIIGTTSLCTGTTTALSNATPGGVWSSSNTAVATVDANGLVTGVLAGTATITYEVTNANGCKTQQTAVVTIKALPVVSPITGTTTVCIGGTTTLSNNTPGGTWSSNNPNLASIGPDGTVNGVVAGTVTITYQLTTAGCFNSTSITMTVADCTNTAPPVAQNDVAETYAETPVDINVLNNDSQQNGTINPASVQIVRQPAHGSVTVKPDGTVTYTPAAGYNGTDNFVYTVKNMAGMESNQATVQITILEAPVAVDDDATTSSDKPVSIPVLANDRGKIDPSTVIVTLQPKQGSVTVNADGTITYTPARKYAGKDNFRYQFKDKNGKVSNEATVNIDVEAEELYIPNAITPNNDGKNDRFLIPGISKYPGTTLTIFNRWGNEVYYSPNYDNRWDGTGLSGGTYYYILKLNTGQDTKVYKGWIQLLR
ncbi:Ig-like domain-containing protein [Chitinophaga sp. HK235]|uniref:Ig-like domain-containing protein n=1 Tax=Chitinophaga sp. HK235 TaxID=2952571 RepID=UPI001BABABFE|nr:Ig-like domain-containing protein [Chitinophaga sp. HK235]